MGRSSACALAVSEHNAAGRLAVTAPTLGSAGTMPAMAFIMKNDLKLSQDAMRRGLLMAGLVGTLCKANASVAGAEVGCQGESGGDGGGDDHRHRPFAGGDGDCRDDGA